MIQLNSLRSRFAVLAHRIIRIMYCNPLASLLVFALAVQFLLMPIVKVLLLCMGIKFLIGALQKG